MRENINKLLLVTKGQRKKLIFVFILMLVSAFIDVLSIGSLFPIFSELLNSGSSNFLNTQFEKLSSFLNFENNLVSFSIITLILFILKNLFMFFYIRMSSFFFSYLSVFHQEKILQSYLSKDYNFMSNKNSSFFLREIVDEAKLLNSNFIQPILAIFLNLLTILFFTFFLMSINLSYTFYLILFSIIFYFSFIIIFKNKIIFFGNQRRIMRLGIINSVKQMFEGFRELIIYDKKFFFVSDIKKRFNRMANVSASRGIISNLPKLFLEVILVFLFLIIILIDQGNKQYDLATLGIFIASAFRVMPNIISLIRSYQKMNYGKTAFDNLVPLLKGKSLNIENENEISNEINLKKELQIKNANFAYNDKNIIFENLNLTLNKNSCIGIKGESGSGKSTLVDIICGFLNINHGKIIIDGKEAEIFNNKNWLRKISYIQQSIYLFDSNISKNIALENDQNKINFKLIEEILSKINMLEFSKKDPNIRLGELGSKISGGQAQRIGIARALYSKSQIIIFDESFNSLDEKNHKQILNLINEIKNNKTIIIISHDNKDFEICEKIYEIKDKKII